MNKLTANNLKEVLWEAIHKVRVGKLDIESANAISAGAREILRATKIQLQVSAYTDDAITEDVENFAGVSKRTRKVGSLTKHLT